MLSAEGDADNALRAGSRDRPRRPRAVSDLKSCLSVIDRQAKSNEALGVSRFAIEKSRSRNHLSARDHDGECNRYGREGEGPLGRDGSAISLRT